MDYILLILLSFAKSDVKFMYHEFVIYAYTRTGKYNVDNFYLILKISNC